MRSRFTFLTGILGLLLITAPADAAPRFEEVIVVLHPTERAVADVASEMAAANSGRVGFVYTTAIQGFTLSAPKAAIAGLSHNPQVRYVEPVREVAAVGTEQPPQQMSTGFERIEADLNPPSVPMEVDIAILDTGVYIGANPDGSARSHLDLNLRFVSDCTGAIFYPLFGGCSGSGDFQDYHGHGTHVAGIAAALDNDIGVVGVAPGATLWSFKVLREDGTGTTGMVLAGIDAVASLADRIEVANMSLGFVGTSDAINDAIAAATDAGVVFVAAAGNDGIDASRFSPANSPDTIAVSALADFDGLPGGFGEPTCRVDQDDTLANFSNFGDTVDIAAPGVCILSTDLDDGYSIKSGTSMAAPFVAGAVARLIAEQGLPTEDRADVEAIKEAIFGAAIPQESSCGFTGAESSPEPLLFLNAELFGGDGTCQEEPVDGAPPTVAFSYECDGLTCEFRDESTAPGGTIESRSWDFGDGTTSEEANPSHTYATDGTYTVSLTVTDDAGAEATTSQDVTVTEAPPNQPPVASFTYDCDGLTCVFTNTSSDPDGDTLTHQWDFGDGSGSTVESPTHTYAQEGAYTVVLTVSDGAETDTATATVDVSEPEASTVVSAAVFPIIVEERNAEVAVWVFDGEGNFVSGATVEGVWTYLDRHGRERTFSASETSSDGTLEEDNPFANVVFSRRFPPNTTVVSFCVSSVSAPGYTYEESVACGWPLE